MLRSEMAKITLAISDGSGADATLAAALRTVDLKEYDYNAQQEEHGLPIERTASSTSAKETSVKDLGRPGLFYGSEDTWTEWSLIMRAWILANCIVTEESLTKIEA